MKFEELGLNDAILKAVQAEGYEKPSPIQAKAIPAILSGKDVLAAAQTGTGKTAGFTLPLLHRLSQGQRARNNQVRALVLTPTRELAAQVAESVSKYGAELPLHSEVVFGGVKINPQMKRLRGGADVLVATPGRLLDLYNQNAINFKSLEILVLDEADRMLDMGFIHDIRKILAVLPAERQNLLFSATFSGAIRKLAGGIVRNAEEISVTPPNSTSKQVKQWLHPVDKKQKADLLISLVKQHDWQQVLVFSRTKHGANKLAKKLDAEDISAAAIHGNKSQGARTKALANFKDGSVRVLVATDIAARGLDIDQLPQVVNFDLPNVAEDYVHRIGRTGRAGATGQAVSLVCADEADDLFGIERLIKQLIPREYVDGFEPVHDVPKKDLDTRPIKPKRPKKPRRTGPADGDDNQPRHTRGGGHRDGQRSGENARGHKPVGKNSQHKRRGSQQDSNNRSDSRNDSRGDTRSGGRSSQGDRDNRGNREGAGNRDNHGNGGSWASGENRGNSNRDGRGNDRGGQGQGGRGQGGRDSNRSGGQPNGQAKRRGGSASGKPSSRSGAGNSRSGGGGRQSSRSDDKPDNWGNR